MRRKKKVYFEAKDYTLSHLLNMCSEDDIIPQPDYQRDYVTDDTKASKLIESILLEIPLPTIYLCEEDDNKYSVIDGQQRITSITGFLKNEFRLNGLEVLRNCIYMHEIERV